MTANPQLKFYKITDGVAGPFGAFAPNDVIGVDGPLPANLRHVADPWPYAPPVNFITLDLKRFETRVETRPEPAPIPPLTEEDVRKKYRLQDPVYWTLARQLAFPAPSMKRKVRDREGRLTMIDLWQQTHCDHWLERVRQLATLLGVR